MVEVQDVRGQEPSAYSDPVLADSSGRRAVVLRFVSWLIALAFVLWFLGLALGGLGVIPTQRFLLGHSLLGQHSPVARTAPAPAYHGRT